MKNISRGACIVLVAGILTAAAQAAEPAAMRLEDALAEAYMRNPDLQSARAELRGVDEGYAQAVSGYRPRLTGEASYVSSYQDGDVRDAHGDPKELSLEARQPLYRGGSTGASVRAADNRILAQRSLLASTEQRVLLEAVTSYMDVLRDTRLVELNLNNEKVLASHLDASRQRFALGDITKTDVSQSEARLSAATADRVRAEGNFRASRAAFEKTVGPMPEGLEKPDAAAVTVPSTLDVALTEAEQHNPDLLYTRYASEAAVASTRAVSGELLPQIDLTGSIARTYDPAQSVNDYVDTATVGIVATMPFYTGGGTDSRVRQARQAESQRRMDINRTDRFVRQSVIDAWTDLASANAEMLARQTQIDTAKLALDGVKVETDYGSRTTLDLLDAEQEYLDAQVAYVIAERNRLVAAYSLLASVGGLSAEKLQLQVSAYDPLKNFQKVKNKWVGTGID